MSDTWLKTIDLAVKSLLYDKFTDAMGFDSDNEDKSVFRSPKDIAMRTLAEKKGEVNLEFINYWRYETSFDWERQRTPLARKGLNLPNADGTEYTLIKTVPVTLRYSFWAWTKWPDKINDVVNDYAFWIHNNPNLGMTLNDTFDLEYDLHFGDVSDESTVTQMFSSGAMFIARFPLVIDAWLLEATEDIGGIIEKIVFRGYDKIYDITVADDFEESTDPADVVYTGDNPQFFDKDIEE